MINNDEVMYIAIYSLKKFPDVDNIGGFNSSLNNNNNLSPEGLNPNIVTLINALIRMNLTERHYSREENFIKLTKFGGIKMKNPNK